MSAALESSAIESRWALRLGRASDAGGVLELRRAAAGYFWHWADKPGHLVPLVGVQDAQGSKPHGFYNMEAAIGHLMSNVGFAFRGDCGLEQVH